MKYLKKFEDINNEKSIDEIKKEILYKFIMRFENEKEFDEFVSDNLDDNNLDSDEEEDQYDDEFHNWDDVPNIVGGEIIIDDEYPNLNETELREIILDIISDVNLDTCIRDDNYHDWKVKMLATEKYNL